jgi:hypothetical protein
MTDLLYSPSPSTEITVIKNCTKVSAVIQGLVHGECVQGCL